MSQIEILNRLGMIDKTDPEFKVDTGSWELALEALKKNPNTKAQALYCRLLRKYKNVDNSAPQAIDGGVFKLENNNVNQLIGITPENISMKEKFEGEVFNITVAEHSSKLVKNGATLIRLIDTEGNRYSFFSTKTDGSPTAAFLAYQVLENPVGKTLEVGIKREEGEFEGKKFTRNKVLFLKEVKKNGNYEGSVSHAKTIDEYNDGVPF